MLHENVRIPLQFALNNVYKILRLKNVLQDDSCTSEILNKLPQLLIAVLNYIVRSNDTHFDATKASTDLVFVILNTDSKMKQEGIEVIKIYTFSET